MVIPEEQVNVQYSTTALSENLHLSLTMECTTQPPVVVEADLDPEPRLAEKQNLLKPSSSFRSKLEQKLSTYSVMVPMW